MKGKFIIFITKRLKFSDTNFFLQDFDSLLSNLGLPESKYRAEQFVKLEAKVNDTLHDVIVPIRYILA